MVNIKTYIAYSKCSTGEILLIDVRIRAANREEYGFRFVGGT